MKKQPDFAGKAFGLLAIALVLLILTLLFGVRSAAQPLGMAETLMAEATDIPQPTSTPPIGPVFSAEKIRVVKEAQLTKESGVWTAYWSPDSTRLALERVIRDPTTGWAKIEIWLATIAEEILKKLIDSGELPSWSSDGKEILYTLANGKGEFEVWTVKAKGGEGKKLAIADSPFAFWLDENRICFLRDDQFIVVNSEGVEQFRKVYSGLSDFAGRRADGFSAHGAKIAYKYDQSQRLLIVDIDSEEQTELVEQGYSTFGKLVWRPDGQKLAFVTAEGPLPSIWVINADGSEKRQLFKPTIKERGTIADLTWSPDGNVIAFTHRPSGGWPSAGGYSVYLVNVEGSHLRQLGLNDIVGGSLQWSPDGTKMTFSRVGGPDDHFIWIAEIVK